MKTYDATAWAQLKGINARYEAEIIPFISRGPVYAQAHREQALFINSLRNQLRFEFEIAALQTIESPEHLAAILQHPTQMVVSSDQTGAGNELSFFSLWGAERRLPDIIPLHPAGHVPFQPGAGRSITHIRFKPIHNGDNATFARTGVPCDSKIANCYLTIDSGQGGTHICIERDALSEEGIGPTGSFEMFKESTSRSLGERLAHLPKPFIWHQHRNFHAIENGPYEEIVTAEETLPYRPRPIDIASVVNYDGGTAEGILTLPDLLKKFDRMGKVGLGKGAHAAVTKDMLTILFDAARVELLDENGQPQSAAAAEAAKKLYLLYNNLG